MTFRAVVDELKGILIPADVSLDDETVSVQKETDASDQS